MTDVLTRFVPPDRFVRAATWSLQYVGWHSVFACPRVLHRIIMRGYEQQSRQAGMRIVSLLPLGFISPRKSPNVNGSYW